MPHHLVIRLLRNRAAFYQELLERIPWEKLRREMEQAAMNLPELLLPDSNGAAEPKTASSPLLASLELDEWLKKDEMGIPKARRIISIENALDEASHLEELGILLCNALLEGQPEDFKGLRAIKSAHARALSALSELRDRLEYHRLTLLDPVKIQKNNGLI